MAALARRKRWSHGSSQASPTPPLRNSHEGARDVSWTCVGIALVLAVTVAGLPHAILQTQDARYDRKDADSNFALHAPKGLTAIAFSGGGFRAMTGAMAVGRVISKLDCWSAVTHVSSGSGALAVTKASTTISSISQAARAPRNAIPLGALSRRLMVHRAVFLFT